jgi:4-hydroxy-tetrahydrodipicolinate synthase
MDIELQGCGSLLVTPFDLRGKIDFGAIERLVEWHIGEGIDFLVTCTPEGESPTLSGDERRAVTAHVTACANGRVPVVAGVGGNHTVKSAFWARDAERAGADAILASMPANNRPSAEGLCQHFAAIGDATRLPLLLSNNPMRTVADLDPDTAVRLAGIPRVAGIVEGSTDFRKITAMSPRLPEGLAMFSADDATCLAGLAAGMRGLFSVAANVAPGVMAGMLRAARDGRWDEARTAHRRYAGLFEALSFETSPGPAKAMLSMMGRCGETLRLPLAGVRDDTRRRIERVLRSLKLTSRAR